MARSQPRSGVDDAGRPRRRARGHALDTQQIKVSIRNLRTDQFITAGYAIDVDIPRLNDLPTLDGLYIAPRTLRRGDAYTATVYTPAPDARASAAARAPTTTVDLARSTRRSIADRARPHGRAARRR